MWDVVSRAHNRYERAGLNAKGEGGDLTTSLSNRNALRALARGPALLEEVDAIQHEFPGVVNVG